MPLPSKKRLKLARDFRAVSKNQLSCKEGKLLLKAKARPTSPASELAGGRASKKEESRFGIVISKVVAKKAVDRNRIKRLLTESIAVNQKLLYLPLDIILVALPGFSLQSQKESNEYIKELFQKISLKISSL